MGAHNSGVYVISTPSGRQYVGSAVHFGTRWSVHKHHLRNGTHHSRKLQAAWNKYGEQLQFSKLLICAREQVVMYEQQAAKVGVKRSDAARAAMSAAHVGKTQSAETIEKRVSKLRGVPRPAHVIEAIAAAHRGRVVSEEQKAKQRATLAATLARKRAEKL